MRTKLKFLIKLKKQLLRHKAQEIVIDDRLDHFFKQNKKILLFKKKV